MKQLLVAAVLVCVGATGAFSQNTQQQYVKKEIVQAKPGESCASKYGGCGEWCDKNKITLGDKTACKQSCSEFQSVCAKTGVWSTPLANTETRGLPLQ